MHEICPRRIPRRLSRCAHGSKIGEKFEDIKKREMEIPR
jgi:hypothetical protein